MKINDRTVQRYTQHIICSRILWFVVVATGVAQVIVVFGIQASGPLALPQGDFPRWPCKAKCGVSGREHSPRSL
jgi:hypothetical protein